MENWSITDLRKFSGLSHLSDLIQIRLNLNFRYVVTYMATSDKQIYICNLQNQLKYECKNIITTSRYARTDWKWHVSMSVKLWLEIQFKQKLILELISFCKVVMNISSNECNRMEIGMSGNNVIIEKSYLFHLCYRLPNDVM